MWKLADMRIIIDNHQACTIICSYSMTMGGTCPTAAGNLLIMIIF